MMLPDRRRRGSVYVLTILTVAAVASIIFIGVAVRLSMNEESALLEQVSARGDGVAVGAEYALARIMSDEDWFENAIKGEIFQSLGLGERSISASVYDAETDAMPTESTSVYRVVIDAESGIARSRASFDLKRVRFDYRSYIDSLGADAYWPLTEPPGSTRASDPIGGRDGVYHDTSVPSGTTNDEGAGVPLFADDNDAIETPYDPAYQDDEEGTVSLWLRIDTDSQSFYGVFGQRFQTIGRTAATMLVSGSGAIMTYLDDSGVFDIDHFTVSDKGVITVGQWHHIAMTWGDGVRIYVDGDLVAENTVCQENWDTRNGSSGEQPLLIGAGIIPGYGASAHVGFEGSIAHFAILSSALNASEIADLAAVKPDELLLEMVEHSWTPLYD